MYADEIVANAWMRSRAWCECERHEHGHPFRCSTALVWERRGQPTAAGGWEVLKSGDAKLGGWQAVHQSEILCWACYEEVMTATAKPRLRAA
jgi:hypothetical protein